MAGTVVLTSHTTVGLVNRFVLTCTADPADASFPAVTLASLGLGGVEGTILSVESNPGATAPTDNWDLTLVDGDGIDRLVSLGLNFHTTTSQLRPVGVPVSPGETLTWTLAGNSVPLAAIVISVTYSRVAASVPRHGTGGGLLVEGASGGIAVDSELTTADLDTGAGTDTRAVVGLVGTASGGGQLIPGSSTDGLLVNLGANNDVALDAASLAALETITVALDAASLAALESITATGPLTDTQLRATPVPVSGTVTANAGTGTLAVSLASVPSHAVTNAGVFAVQVDGAALTALQLLDDAIAGTEMQVDIVASLPAGTNAIGKLAANSGVDIGDVDVVTLPATVHSADYDSGAGTDTTLAFGIAVPAAGGAAVVPGDATAGLKVDLGADNDVTVTGTVTANLAAGANNIGDVDVLTVPAPLNVTGTGLEATALRVTLASDSTGLVSVDDNAGSLTIDNAALSVTGTGLEATALRVTIASDSTGVLSVDDNAGSLTVDGTVAATQSGTWTVQPGNTANTTAWKTDGSAVTQPVSAASLPLPTGASTAAKQPALGTAGAASADVITVQGIASGTVVPVSDGGGSLTVDGTVAVSGTVTVDTELPAAVALSDTLANPTAPAVGAHLLGWDGTQWVRVDVDAAGALMSVGNVASGAADSGAPVKVGGRVSTTSPANAITGDRKDAWLGAGGQLIVGTIANTGTDGSTASHFLDPSGTLVLPPAAALYNGTNWDRRRNNHEATLLASAARTATTNSPDQTNYNGRGIHVSIDVTVEGPATLAIKIQGKHSVGGTYYDIVDFGTVYTAATDAPGPKTVSLYPGILTADHVGVGAGVSGTIGKSAVLPRTWRAVVTHADATTCTYSLSAVTIL